MIESPYNKDIYVTRTLFLVETAPLSDTYCEVMLTREQHGELRKLVETFLPKIEHQENCDCPNPEAKGFLMPITKAEAHLPQFRGEFTQKEIDDELKDQYGEPTFPIDQ